MNAPHDDPHLRLHATLGGRLSVALKCDALPNEHDRHFGIGKPIRVAAGDLGKSIDELAAIYFPQHFELPRPAAGEAAAPSASCGAAGDSSPILPSVAPSPRGRRSAFFDRASTTH
jgi:hypothetical protein